MDELLFLPNRGEIDLDAAYHALRRSTFFTQHRLTETEISHHNEGMPVLSMLRREAAAKSADFALRHGHMKFREIPPHEVSEMYADRPGKFFKSQLTILHHEDADRLEWTFRKLMKLYGPRIQYQR